jgi:hypothetical protein
VKHHNSQSGRVPWAKGCVGLGDFNRINNGQWLRSLALSILMRRHLGGGDRPLENRQGYKELVQTKDVLIAPVQRNYIRPSAFCGNWGETRREVAEVQLMDRNIMATARSSSTFISVAEAVVDSSLVSSGRSPNGDEHTRKS